MQLTSDNGKVHYLDTSNAPQVFPINHNNTFSGHTEWKQVQLKEGRYITNSGLSGSGDYVKVFFRCTLYTVLGNKVYAKYKYSIEMPPNYRHRNKRKVLIEKTKQDYL